MDVLRTPDDQFADLPGWSYAPHYAEVSEGLRAHYVDEGPRQAPVVLLMHGEPTWGYLYRHMIPPLIEAGLRVVVPDLIGFGRSDKPADRADHSFAAHVAWMRELLLDQMGLQDITMFCQDWGSLIGLRLVGEHPDRFAAVAVGNGGLPTGEQQMPEAFLKWQQFAASTPTFPVGSFVQGASQRKLSDAEVAAYDAPFLDETFKEGPRMMPSLVPTSPDNPATAANRAAWTTLMTFQKPLLTLFSDGDPITAGGERVFHKLVPGAAGQPHATMSGGHFLQEDCGPALAAHLIALMAQQD